MQTLLIIFANQGSCMKHKGSISHTYKRRDAVAIPLLFRKAKTVAEYPISIPKLLKIAADLPVDRFYITDDAALRYVRKRFYGRKRLTYRSKYKERLFDALYEQVCLMMGEDKYRKEGLATTTILALSRPAPCVGLTPNEIYLRYLKLRGNNRKKDDHEKV